MVDNLLIIPALNKTNSLGTDIQSAGYLKRARHVAPSRSGINIEITIGPHEDERYLTLFVNEKCCTVLCFAVGSDSRMLFTCRKPKTVVYRSQTMYITRSVRNKPFNLCVCSSCVCSSVDAILLLVRACKSCNRRCIGVGLESNLRRGTANEL